MKELFKPEKALIVGKDCPKCDGSMGHYTAAQFKWAWWECTHCGYKEGNIPPNDVLEWHRGQFERDLPL